MKKTLALLLSFALVFAIAVPVFAVEDDHFGLRVALVEYKYDEESQTYVPDEATRETNDEENEEPEESEEPSEEPAIEPDYEAGATVFYKVSYYLPYEGYADFEDIAQEGVDKFVLAVGGANLKDIELVASRTIVCTEETCSVPDTDLSALDGIYDASKLTANLPYGYNGFLVFKATVNKTAETKFDASITYGTGSEAHVESVNLIFNEGIVDTSTPEPENTVKPGAYGGATMIVAALASAMTGLGVFTLRRKH